MAGREMSGHNTRQAGRRAHAAQHPGSKPSLHTSYHNRAAGSGRTAGAHVPRPAAHHAPEPLPAARPSGTLGVWRCWGGAAAWAAPQSPRRCCSRWTATKKGALYDCARRSSCSGQALHTNQPCPAPVPRRRPTPSPPTCAPASSSGSARWCLPAPRSAGGPPQKRPPPLPRAPLPAPPLLSSPGKGGRGGGGREGGRREGAKAGRWGVGNCVVPTGRTFWLRTGAACCQPCRSDTLTPNTDHIDEQCPPLRAPPPPRVSAPSAPLRPA